MRRGYVDISGKEHLFMNPQQALALADDIVLPLSADL